MNALTTDATDNNINRDRSSNPNTGESIKCLIVVVKLATTKCCAETHCKMTKSDC